MNFRIRYYAKKHDKKITRDGTYDHKSRSWHDKKGNFIITYFDDKQKNYRHAVNPEWWYNITPSEEVH